MFRSEHLDFDYPGSVSAEPKRNKAKILVLAKISTSKKGEKKSKERKSKSQKSQKSMESTK